MSSKFANILLTNPKGHIYQLTFDPKFQFRQKFRDKTLKMSMANKYVPTLILVSAAFCATKYNKNWVRIRQIKFILQFLFQFGFSNVLFKNEFPKIDFRARLTPPTNPPAG
jgi:hypothetical protein